MSDRITKLTTLVDGTRCLRCTVAGHAAWEGELLEHLLHTLFILADVRVHFAVCSLQICVGDLEIAAMTGTGYVDHIQIVSFDHTVTGCPDKVLPRNGSPVAYNFLLNMFHGQWCTHKRVVQQIQLSGRQVVGSTPVSVHFLQHLIIQRLLFKTSIFAHNKLLSTFSIYEHLYYIGTNEFIQAFFTNVIFLLVISPM